MQVIINVSRERRTDTGDFLDVGDPCAHDFLQPAEMLEQSATLGRPEPRHDLEHRFVVAAGALAPVAGDGETMRLIAHSLHEP